MFRTKPHLDQLALPVAALVTLLSSAGCQQFQYVTSLVGGELSVQLQARPIEEVLATDRLDEETRGKLQLVQRVRDYAINRMGLLAGNSFTFYHDTRGLPVAYNLSAVPKTALTPYLWTIPFVGTVPNLIFFELDPVLAEIEFLRSQDLDTFAYEVEAYSTRGFLADPVRSSLLEGTDPHIINIILHELTHNTIWRPADTPFNESLATFVGQTGTLDFLRETFGPEGPLLVQAREEFDDEGRFNAFLADLYDRLDEFYASPIPEDEKIADRGRIFQEARERFRNDLSPNLTAPSRFEGVLDLPENNAWIVVNRRYTLDLDLFNDVHEASSSDFVESLVVFSQAARAPVAKDYLRGWLEDR